MKDLAVYKIPDAPRRLMLELARRDPQGFTLCNIQHGEHAIFFIAFASGRIVNLNSCHGDLPENIRRLEGIECD